MLGEVARKRDEQGRAAAEQEARSNESSATAATAASALAAPTR